MKRSKKTTLLLVFVLSLALLTISYVLAAPNPFIGKWYSTDPYDGSQQWMVIGGGSHQHPITYFDKGASSCTPEGAEKLYPARAKGWGSVDGLTFTAAMKVWCQKGSQKGFLGEYTFEFQYDTATETLFEPSGTVWHR